MNEIIITAAVALLIFIVFFLLVGRSKNTPRRPDTFVCTHCNEQDCACHRIQTDKDA